MEVNTIRYTPAGIPIINLVLEHESTQAEFDTPRLVKLRLRAVAFGSHAETLSQQAFESNLYWQGFLANAHNAKGVVFHIQDFSKI